jgi:hypothetical protein
MDGNQILPIALASVPTMLTVLVGILINNSRLSDMNTRIGELRSHMDSRFDDMRVTWSVRDSLPVSAQTRVEQASSDRGNRRAVPLLPRYP